MAKLGEVCKVSPSTKNIERQGAWLLNLDMVEQQTGRVIEYKYVGEDDLNGSIIQFDTENVLYSKLRPNLNKVVLPPKDGFSTSELLPLRPDASVLNKDYLAAFLRSDSFVTWAVSKTAGAKMPRLGTKDLMNAEIPVPSIEQQKKIAEKFKKLEQLISLRKQQLAKLDELVKARFVEMFLLHDYPTKTLDELSIGKGEYGAQSASTEYDSTRPRYIRITDVNEDGTLNDDKVSSENITDDEQYRLSYGDFMFARMGATVGKTYAFLSGNQIFAGYLIRYKLNLSLTNPRYLFWYTKLDDYQKWVKLNQSGAAQPGINAKKYGSLKIPVPPIALQNQFAAFVERVDQQKQTVQQSLEKLKLMKKALMQEYFG